MKKIIETLKDFFEVLFKEFKEEDDILYKDIASKVMFELYYKGGDAA